MKVLVDLSVVPIGVGVSLSKYIAACEKVLSDAGLETHIHGYGTNVQGEWDSVFAAVKKCHQVIHEMGAPRILTTVRCSTRVDREDSFSSRIRSVEEKLSGD